jgi:hypothetical protein
VNLQGVSHLLNLQERVKAGTTLDYADLSEDDDPFWSSGGEQEAEAEEASAPSISSDSDSDSSESSGGATFTRTPRKVK